MLQRIFNYFGYYKSQVSADRKACTIILKVNGEDYIYASVGQLLNTESTFTIGNSKVMLKLIGA